MVVDVGGKVAGSGPVPHACIGKARRVPARDRAGQAAAILEAVHNHAPQVRHSHGRIFCPNPPPSSSLRDVQTLHGCLTESGCESRESHASTRTRFDARTAWCV